MWSHPGQVSFFPLRSGWFGFVRSSGLFLRAGASVLERFATAEGVAGVFRGAGVALLPGLLRVGLDLQASSMPGYLLCPLPGSGDLAVVPGFGCAVSPGTGEQNVPGCLDWIWDGRS